MYFTQCSMNLEVFQSGRWEQALFGLRVSARHCFSNPFGCFIVRLQAVSSHAEAD